jgi:hypothetical protein
MFAPVPEDVMTQKQRLDQMPRDALCNLARELGIPRPRSMTRDELIRAIEAKRKSGAPQASGSRRAAPRRQPATPPAAAASSDAVPKPAEQTRERDKPAKAPPVPPAFRPGRLAAAPRPFPRGELLHLDDATAPLKQSYGDDRLVILPRDPWWVWIYWQLSDATLGQARARGGRELVLRVFALHEGGESQLSEHRVPSDARGWYVNVPKPDTDHRAELGMYTEQGEYLMLLSSNTIQTPPASPSEEVRDVFVSISWHADLREMFKPALEGAERQAVSPRPAALHESMYRVAQQSFDGGGRADSAALPRVHEMGGPRVGSFALASQALASSPGERPRTRDFWLVADAELIVFGATEPDARVTLGGQPLALRPDGSFSVRFAFPDGVIDAPIEAVAVDGEQCRSIHLRFQRETKP